MHIFHFLVDESERARKLESIDISVRGRTKSPALTAHHASKILKQELEVYRSSD